MSSKLKIRIGDVEIEYEGSDDFLKQELPELLKTAMELRKVSRSAGSDAQDSVDTERKGSGGGNGAAVKGTTAAIAARLKVSSGPDLLLAAAARMTFVSGKDTFIRQELLTEMQSAASYYKKSYSANLTAIIARRIDEGDLTETSSNNYALTATTKERLEKQLAHA